MQHLAFIRKAISAPYKIVAGRFFKKSYPLSVTFYVTYRCNHTCNYCQIWKWDRHEMSTADVAGLIDQFHANGVLRLGIVGGEPLLRDDIGEIISYGHRKGLITTLCTNGVLIPKKIDTLADTGIIVISLDGIQEHHDAARGKGTFEKALAGIKVAVEAGHKVWICAVLTKQNMECIDTIIDFAMRYRVKCSFQPVSYYSGSEEDMDHMIPSVEQFRLGVKKLLNYKSKTRVIGISKGYLEALYNYWPDKLNATNLNCSAGRMYCVVDSYGHVSGCQPDPGKIKGLNALDVGFREAFDRIPAFNCPGCFCDALVETNLLFSLNRSTVFNTFTELVRP